MKNVHPDREMVELLVVIDKAPPRAPLMVTFVSATVEGPEMSMEGTTGEPPTI